MRYHADRLFAVVHLSLDIWSAKNKRKPLALYRSIFLLVRYKFIERIDRIVYKMAT